MTAIAAGLRAAGWLGGIALGTLSLSSVLRQPLAPREWVALTLFTVLSILRPLDALLILAAFGPIISIVGVLFGFTFTGARMLEALVLLLLVPWMIRQLRSVRSPVSRPLDWALIALAAIVAASAATHLPVLALRQGAESPWRLLWQYFTTTYLARPAGFSVINDAMLLLEGVGLCAMIPRLASEPRNALGVASMVVAGAAGAATMNVYRLLEVALRRGPVTETLAEILTSMRINTQFPDLNAAGSYFSMAFVAAVGLSGVRSGRGAACALASLPLGLAVWLSGSRTAMAGALLGSLGVFVMRHRDTARAVMRSRRVLVAAAATLAAVAIAAALLYPPARNVSVQYSVWARLELIGAGLRMVGDRPLLGVGVSRFYELFPRYASPELRQKFFESALVPVTHENAHNNFLQIFAELGALGLTAFVAVLWLALRPDERNGNAAGLRLMLVASVATFLFTAMFGHPLLTREVAYPFWILLGACAAGSRHLSSSVPRTWRLAIAGLVVALAATAPMRASYEWRDASLEGMAVGMSNWDADAAGNRFRWAGSRSTLFVGPTAPVLTLPLQAAGAATCTVDIAIEGRPADRVRVPAGFWRDVRLRLPPAKSQRSFRIDLAAAGDCAGPVYAPTRKLMVGRTGELGLPSGTALPR